GRWRPPSTYPAPRPARRLVWRPPQRWARYGAGCRPWPTTPTPWPCRGRSPRGCSPRIPPTTRCTSSTTTSCPTPAPVRSPRAGTPNAVTPNPGATTPWWWTPGAGPWSSAPVSRRGWRPTLAGCWPSCAWSSARMPRSCSASIAAGPTLPRSAPAGTLARPGSAIGGAPPPPPTPPPPPQPSIPRAGAAQVVLLADETVQIKDYGPARQLTLYEHDAPVLQVLTSDTT